jgi:hypothetical protein
MYAPFEIRVPAYEGMARWWNAEEKPLRSANGAHLIATQPDGRGTRSWRDFRVAADRKIGGPRYTVFHELSRAEGPW